MTSPVLRREPPRFRTARVAAVEERTPTLVRVTLAGDDLVGLDDRGPAASVRLLLPDVSSGEVVVPTWNGNEFLDPDGRRPPIRTLTPVRIDPVSGELDVEVVLHGHAPLSDWAREAEPGGAVAVSGTGRGYEIVPSARRHLLVGDESALPAISTIVAALPADATVEVLVEHRVGTEQVALPDHPGTDVRWFELTRDADPGAAMVAAVEAWAASGASPDMRIWAAGEAAAVQRIRRQVLDDVGIPRSNTVIRGYWKHGRAGT